MTTQFSNDIIFSKDSDKSEVTEQSEGCFLSAGQEDEVGMGTEKLEVVGVMKWKKIYSCARWKKMTENSSF